MVTKGLLVTVKAKPGKEAEVQALLFDAPSIRQLDVLADKLPG